MERNNHPQEATVLKTIHNWHKAVDGRGLNKATRSDYCKAKLNLILEAWIPYLKTEQPDYSFIDVNRCVCVCVCYMYIVQHITETSTACETPIHCTLSTVKLKFLETL